MKMYAKVYVYKGDDNASAEAAETDFPFINATSPFQQTSGRREKGKTIGEILEFFTTWAGREEVETKAEEVCITASESIREEEIKVKKRGCPFIDKKKEITNGGRVHPCLLPHRINFNFTSRIWRNNNISVIILVMKFL